MTSMTRAIPVSLYLREDRPWLSARAGTRDVEDLSASARDALELLQRQGALFSIDLTQQLQLLPSQLDEVLGELASSGWLTADGFAGLRQLIRQGPSGESARLAGRYRRVRKSLQGPGRWTAMGAVGSSAIDQDAIEEWAWQLVRRWGVVFRNLALREQLAPQWWELLKVYRRLEARGELRGGRFISQVSGEQFATSDAVRELRSLRRNPSPSQLLVISAADPLNLTGVLGPGPRIPALTEHQVVYLQGRVVGWKKAEETWISPDLSAPQQQRLAEEWHIAGFMANSQPDPPREPDASQENGAAGIDPAADEPKKKKPRRRAASRAGIPRPFPF
jgi:ATP-dependent Lhr-like helicase